MISSTSNLILFFRFFVLNLLQRVFSLTYYDVFCYRFVMTDSYKSTIDFLVSFRINSLDDKTRSKKIIRSNLIHIFLGILYIFFFSTHTRFVIKSVGVGFCFFFFFYSSWSRFSELLVG